MNSYFYLDTISKFITSSTQEIRARQGMVILVPEDDNEDGTRKREYYDETFEYLMGIGIGIIKTIVNS